MKHKVHVVISDINNLQFPFELYIDGIKIPSTIAQTMLQEASHHPENYDFIMTQEERAKLVTQLLPKLPKPNMSEIRAGSSSDRECIITTSPLYLMNPPEPPPFADVVGNLDDTSGYIIGFGQSVVEGIEYGIDNTPIHKLPGYGSSNKVFGSELRLRSASKETAGFIDHHMTQLEKYTKYLQPLKFAARCYDYSNQGYGDFSALAHATFDSTADYVQENYISVKGGLKTASRYVITAAATALGIKLTGGLTIIIPFIIGEGGEYLFVEYMWGPSIEWLKNDANIDHLRLIAPPELIHHGIDLSDHETPYIPQLSQSTGQKEAPDNKLATAHHHTILAPLSHTSLISSASSSSWLRPTRQSSTSNPAFDSSKRFTSPVSLTDKQLKFQSALRREFDYQNPTSFNRSPQSLLHFDPNRLIRTEDRQQTHRSHQPSFSFTMNNDAGSLRWQASIDPVKHPQIAGGLFALHLIKNAIQWLKLSDSDICKRDIQTHIRHFDELHDNRWVSYNTWLWVCQNSPDDMKNIHKQRLATSLSEYARLNSNNQEIISAVKVMYFLNATDNYDGLKLFSCNDSIERDFNKYTDLYTQTFIKKTNIVTNALNDHQLKRAEREIAALASMFPYESLTHATRGVLLFEKEQYSEGESAFATALQIATTEFEKLQQSPVIMPSHDTIESPSTFVSDHQLREYAVMQHGDKINTAKAFVSEIEKMQLASYHHAYQHTEGANQQHILKQWEHAAHTHVTHNPYSYDAQRGLVDVYLLQNKKEEAINLYKDIDKTHKNMPNVKFNLGLLLYQSDRIDESKLYFQDYQGLSSKRKDSKNEEQLLYSCHILQHIFMDEYAKTQDVSLLNNAAEQAKLIASSSATSTEQRLDQIRFIAHTGQLQDALDLAKMLSKDIYRLDRQTSESYIELNKLLGEIHLHMQNPKEAQGHFAWALAATPNDPELLTQYGIARLHNRDTKGAKAAFKQALLHQPDHKIAQSNLDAINSDMLSTCLSESAYELGMTLLDFGFSYFMTDQTSNLGRAFGSLGKFAVVAAPYVYSLTDFLGQTHVTTKTSHFGELVLRYRVPTLFAGTTGGCVRGAIGDGGFVIMQGASCLLSTILIADSYFKGYYLGEKREHVAFLSTTIGVASKIEQLSGGTHMLSSVQDLIGADLASNIVCIEGALFLTARSFDLAEYLNKQCGYERWENGAYHATKTGIQSTATVAGIGALVGKATLAVLAKASVSCNPLIIVSAVGATAVSVGAYQTYYYYADSQLAAMAENAKSRFDNKDFYGAFEKIQECKSVETENTQLITYIHSVSAGVHVVHGNYHDAINDLELCYKLNPNDENIKSNRYNAHRNVLSQKLKNAFDSNDLPLVIKLHQDFLYLFPDEPLDSQIYRNLNSTKLIASAQHHADRGHYKYAVHDINRYMLINPEDDTVKDYLLSVYAKRWELLIEQQKLTKAIRECENFIQTYDGMDTAQFIHARMLLVQSINAGEYQRAITMIDKYLLHNPNDKTSLLEKRQALSLVSVEQATQQANQTHHYQAAFDAFASHMEYYPDDTVTQERWQRLRYHASYSAGDFEHTILHCNAMLDEQTADTQALRYRSRAYMALNQLSAAESDLKLLLSSNRDDHDAWFQQGIINAKRGYLGIPLKHVKTAMSCLPQEPDNQELHASYQQFHQSLTKQIQSLQDKTVATAVGHTMAAGINYVTQYYVNATSSAPLFFIPTKATVCAPSMHIKQEHLTTHFDI